MFFEFLNQVHFYNSETVTIRPIESRNVKVSYEQSQPKGSNFCKQTHSSSIVPAHFGDGRTEADGLYLLDESGSISVQTADCLPILIRYAQDLYCCLHAGWKGLAAGIIEEAMQLISNSMSAFDPNNLYVELGPCISQHAFEVGPEVVEQIFAKKHFKSPDPRLLSLNKGVADRWHVDLQLVALGVLQSFRVQADNISVYRECTFQKASRWPSYRRDGAQAKRLWSTISVRV